MSRLDELLAADKPPAQPCDLTIVRGLLPDEERSSLDRLIGADPKQVPASVISRIVRRLGQELGNPSVNLSPGVITRHRRKDCVFCNEQKADMGGRNARGKAR